MAVWRRIFFGAAGASGEQARRLHGVLESFPGGVYRRMKPVDGESGNFLFKPQCGGYTDGEGRWGFIGCLVGAMNLAGWFAVLLDGMFSGAVLR
jgi:hypothetical protein